MKIPYGADREAQAKDRTDRVMGYKTGGRVDDEKGTKINITIGGGSGTTDKQNSAMAGLSALAQASKPPSAPPAPPMGGAGQGPAMVPPGLGPRPGMKRGGRALSAAADVDAPKKKASGGAMTAGSESGLGRLEKAQNAK